MPEFNQIWSYGPTVVLLGMVLVFLIKFAPMWKEVRLRELEIRAEENQTHITQAAALTTLGDVLTSLSSVLKSIAVDQRRATEAIEISQRVNADTNDHLSTNVRLLNEHIASIEDAGGSTLAQVAIDVHKLRERVGNIEKHVEPEGSAAGA